ncbi:FliM/FliN family flagellar motor switch protein [Salipiger mucosus]|nr:FliM/FliN family flagellar motor switch protein [Salipiger mucosus]
MAEQQDAENTPEQTDPNQDAEDTVSEDGAEELQQSDIDDMMGTNPQAKEQTFSTFEEQIIHMSMLNFEKLPMLDVIFERMVVELNSSLKAYTAANVDVSISSIRYMSCGEAISSIPVPGLLPVVRANPWDGNLLMGVDARLLYAALEIKLGGRHSDPAPTEGRNFTFIEQTLGKSLSRVFLNDLKNAFSQLVSVEFDIERTETNPQFANIGQPNAPAIHVQLDVELDKRKGKVDFVIPYLTIEPVRKLLTTVFYGENIAGDPAWREHIRAEIEHSHVDVRAILHQMKMPMEDVLGMKTGSTIELNVEPDQPATVLCAGNPLAMGDLGRRRNGMMALQVTETLYSKEKLADALDRD